MKALNFDAFFQYIQSEMIKVCLDFSNGKSEKIFIYVCCEDSLSYANAFFYINKEIRKKHKLELEESLKDSIKRQTDLLNHLKNLNIMLQMLCEYNQSDMPTEIKIIYDVNLNKTKSMFKYDRQFNYEQLRGSDTIFNEWFDEMKAEIEG